MVLIKALEQNDCDDEPSHKGIAINCAGEATAQALFTTRIVPV